MKRALQLVLIRHGETAWSLSGQHTGVTDLPLTAQGLAMAQALRPMLAGLNFTQVLVSPRLRARSTCEGAGLGAGAVTEADLAEWDYGQYEGLRTTEIQALRPDWDVWTDGCPGGEGPAQATARADRLIARLRGLEGTVALFSHGQFGRVLAARWNGWPVAEGRHLRLDPAAVSVLGYEPGHPQRPVLALWNASADGLRRYA